MLVEELHTIMRGTPEPVISEVNGYAIGRGHVLHILYDFTIAYDNSIFGQVGPSMGSEDPRFGTAHMARLVGGKKRGNLVFLSSLSSCGSDVNRLH